MPIQPRDTMASKQRSPGDGEASGGTSLFYFWSCSVPSSPATYTGNLLPGPTDLQFIKQHDVISQSIERGLNTIFHFQLM
jgi:hypothetical protein